MAPTTIDKPSIEAYVPPCFSNASQRDASATDGAALKRPAKLFGLNRSPTTEKKDTMAPPIMNLTNMSDHMVLFAGYAALLRAFTSGVSVSLRPSLTCFRVSWASFDSTSRSAPNPLASVPRDPGSRCGPLESRESTYLFYLDCKAQS